MTRITRELLNNDWPTNLEDQYFTPTPVIDILINAKVILLVHAAHWFDV